MTKITIKDTRKLTVAGGKSYSLTIPQEMIKSLKWKKGEKKTITLSGKKIIIEDWKKNT